jgi:hypothetical protein
VDYQSFPNATYTFLLFTKDRFAGDDPTSDFLEGVDLLANDNNKSLPDNDYKRMPNLYQTRVVGGWYNRATRSYGYVQMQVEPSTSSSDGVGTLFSFNDSIRTGHASDGWVVAHWKDAGNDLYVNFAAANDPPVILGVSVTDFNTGTPADHYDVSPSQR